MTASPRYFKELCETVPVCDHRATVETVVQQFRVTQAHRLVLLDDGGDPVGLVQLPRLLSHILDGRSDQLAIVDLQPPVIEPLSIGAGPRAESDPRARELAAKNADLVQLNRLKDDFLACISHELRTPLTAVLGLSTLLKDQALGPLNERQLRYAELIYRSGRHLMVVVNDILDLTRMETGQLELSLEPVNIGTVCLQAYEQAQKMRSGDRVVAAVASSPVQAAVSQSLSGPSAVGQVGHGPASPPPAVLSHGSGESAEPPPGPTFSLDLEPGVETLIADPTRLRQVLINLLSNALKFTADTGRLGLRVNRWEGWIAFTVWDTGIGIPPEKQHLIFQKFQQLENPMTRQFEGAGLGLVLAQRLARLHGGDISFTSQEGQGSQFTLLLPPIPPGRFEARWSPPPEDRAPTARWSAPEGWSLDPNADDSSHVAADRAPGAAPAGIPDGGPDGIPDGIPDGSPSGLPTRAAPNRLVLVVEAIPRYLEDANDQLTELGYRVVLARSGTEALEKARNLQPCVILLNPDLPTLSGWDVLTLLKADTQTRTIPLLITGAKEDQAQADRLGANDFLDLPLCPPNLAAALDHWSQTPRRAPITADRRIILCLSPQGNSVTLDFNALLHGQNYRLIESHDLEQAELLARVWKPQVLLLTGTHPDPVTYLTELSQSVCLSALPLVTLDATTTQAANQIPGLAVFPCLSQTLLGGSQSAHTLLQVIEVAVGFAGRPCILAVDLAEAEAGRSDWLQALMQYIQAAGMRGMIGHAAPEARQLPAVNLLLLYWRGSRAELMAALQTLKRLPDRPPMLLIDHHDGIAEVSRWSGPGEGSRSAADRGADRWNAPPRLSSGHSGSRISERSGADPLGDLLTELNLTILSPEASMAALLRQIQQTLGVGP
jgi:signal transduction histidine kinase/CheY-like chemotaxis protein